MAAIGIASYMWAPAARPTLSPGSGWSNTVPSPSMGDDQLTPTTYVMNKRGEIVKQYVGEPSLAEPRLLIEKLLAEA